MEVSIIGLARPFAVLWAGMAQYCSRLGRHSPKGAGRVGPKETARVARRAHGPQPAMRLLCSH